MKVAIFTPADSLSGGNYRVANVLRFFPRGKYVLLMPRNRKYAFIDVLTRFGGKSDALLSIISDAYELRDYYCKDIPCHIKYGYYVGRVVKELGADILYFPHEHAYLPLGFKASNTKWTELLQLTPVIGSLTIEEGFGFSLLMKNLRVNFNYGFSKILRGYIRFRLFTLAVRNTPILAVSKSIPYELEKLGVKVDVRVVDPGVGVDPCPFTNLDKVFDVAFFARVTPEKGVFDFLRVVANLVKWRRNIRALVMGFAGDKMAVKVREMASELGIAGNVEFRFNAPRDEAMRLLAQSKLVIYPTRLDSISLSVLEALSCGTPVIAYAIPAIRFNYADTRAVIKTKPLDIEEMTRRAIEALEGEAWRGLGREAVEFTRKYTWENVAKTEWNTLQSIMQP